MRVAALVLQRAPPTTPSPGQHPQDKHPRITRDSSVGCSSSSLSLLIHSTIDNAHLHLGYKPVLHYLHGPRIVPVWTFVGSSPLPLASLRARCAGAVGDVTCRRTWAAGGGWCGRRRTGRQAVTSQAGAVGGELISQQAGKRAQPVQGYGGRPAMNEHAGAVGGGYT